MNPKTHYALLVAINLYPGLSDLNGPENDAKAFADWLIEMGGLESDQVKTIKSSDFVRVTDPYDAKPTDTQIKQTLNAWLKKDGQWLDHVGERLYLFFAGHGFTAGVLEDPVLYTARAQLDDREYIAALRYARKIAVGGFFDEIVLVMDCCQDVLKATAITEPAWSPPDRQADPRVKMMRAFGAPRGQKAFEQPPPVEGSATTTPVHGYFSSVFIEALRDADSDAEGWVTARAVEARFGELWTERYLKFTGYEPPFYAPPGMRLYRRGTVTPGPTAAGSGQAGGGLTREAFEKHPELLKTAEGVLLVPDELGARVRVFDMQNRQVLPGGLGDPLTLPPGDYMARVKVGSTVLDRALRVEPKPPKAIPEGALRGWAAAPVPEPMRFAPKEFASPMPAWWSTTHHEYQVGPAQNALRQSVPAAPMDGLATLLVFARDSAHTKGTWLMNEALRAGMRLRRLRPDDGEVDPLHVNLVVDPGSATCTFTRHLPGGTYLLGVRRRLRKSWIWDEMVVHVAAPGWRTEVWIDAIDDVWDGRRFDLESASMRVARRDRADPLEQEAARQTELLRETLTDEMRAPGSGGLLGNHVRLPDDPADLGPIGVLLAATLMTRGAVPDFIAVAAAVAWLGRMWSTESADVVALRQACEMRSTKGPSARLAVDAVPMLTSSWALLADSPGHTALSAQVQRSVGWWRTGSALWVMTQRNDEQATTPSVTPPPAMPPNTLPRLRGGEPDLHLVASALGRPFPALSPLHQALRAALLDAKNEDNAAALPAAIDSVAVAAGLSVEVVYAAVADLWHAVGKRNTRNAGATEIAPLPPPEASGTS